MLPGKRGLGLAAGLLGVLGCLHAQTAKGDRALALKARKAPAAIQEAQEGRVALVIGNGAYAEAPLRNPAHDARAVAAALKQCGFQVQTLVDATLPQMEAALRRFGQQLKAGGGVGLFYYAGHGMQVGGANFLIPVASGITEEDEVKFKALDANQVLAKMESAGNGLNLMILDACRNDPFKRAWHRGTQGGLAQMEAPTGTYIAFATSPGRTASDGGGEHGLYTQEFLGALKQPGLKVEEVFKQVRVGVKRLSKDQQVPWDSSSLTGEFYFVAPKAAPVVAESPAPMPKARVPKVMLISTFKDTFMNTGFNLQYEETVKALKANPKEQILEGPPAEPGDSALAQARKGGADLLILYSGTKTGVVKVEATFQFIDCRNGEVVLTMDSLVGEYINYHAFGKPTLNPKWIPEFQATFTRAKQAWASTGN